MDNYDLNTKEGMVNAMLWTKQLVNNIRDGGKWLIPRSGTVVTFDKKKQIATVDAPFGTDTSVTRVLKAMGWKIIMK
jgi:hypothetical protein